MSDEAKVVALFPGKNWKKTQEVTIFLEPTPGLFFRLLLCWWRGQELRVIYTITHFRE